MSLQRKSSQLPPVGAGAMSSHGATVLFSSETQSAFGKLHGCFRQGVRNKGLWLSKILFLA